MRAAVYSPYLDSFGGGERYILTVAEVLTEDFDNVDILLDTHLQSIDLSKVKERLTTQLKLDLSKITFVNAPLGHGSNWKQRNKFLKEYDFIFCLTDGSIFHSSAKKSILHIQTPLVKNLGNPLLNLFKLKSWDLIVYNSEFTKKHASKYWKLSSKVIYPPVNTVDIKPLPKIKIILSVGRFFGYLREKKHEFMIDAFKKLYDKGEVSGWKLVLAGSALDGDKPYIDELNNLVTKYPIEIRPNLSYGDLLKLYGESSIYWHAMGFEESDPTKMEHFGITTVEAMAGGCVPIVINKGGQLEIVENEKSGFLWNTPEELLSITKQVIDDPKLLTQVSKKAINKSREFSKERFTDEIKKLYR